MKLYQGAEQRLLDDGAWVTLYHYASRALIRPGVKGLERSPLSTAPEFGRASCRERVFRVV